MAKKKKISSALQPVSEGEYSPTTYVDFDDLKEVTPENIRAVTQAYTRLLENAVREHPDHWFWMHRRWKTKAPGPGPD